MRVAQTCSVTGGVITRFRKRSKCYSFVRCVLIAPATAILLATGTACSLAQWAGASSDSRFELSETVQLDRIDNAVAVQLERVEALLAERQWKEAVAILCQVVESSGDKLIDVNDLRYISLDEWCQSRLAGLPIEALSVYRAGVDPVAKTWCEEGIAQRNATLLMVTHNHSLLDAFDRVIDLQEFVGGGTA